MDRPISLVGIIIDREPQYDMAYILSLLKGARINGHDVIHVVVKEPHAKDEVLIPHINHHCLCEERNKCTTTIPKPWPCLRNFNIMLILDGAVALADWDVTDFELQMGVLVMIVNVVVVPQVDKDQRWDLVKPWRK